MALYTSLDSAAFEAVSAAYGLGGILEVSGIPEGSINTNYRLTCTEGRYFVRHTSVRLDADLEFEAAVLARLCAARFPAASLVLTREGAPFLPVAGGRLSVFQWLPGEELGRRALTPAHLERLGATLATFHGLMDGFTLERANPYGPPCVRGWIEGLLAHPEREVSRAAQELEVALEEAVALRASAEPRAIIHADLFMDNVKWSSPEACAFFDFEMACRDAASLDVAITLNAWCFDAGAYQEPLCRAFLAGYRREHAFPFAGGDVLFGRALFGAVRYTASRIRDFHLSPLPPDQLTRKDFRTYLGRVRTLRALGPRGFRSLTGS